MARKRRGQPIHGWLVLDKPLGMTSSRAVGAVRRLLDAAKAGHGGTLDPLATGVLPIALGEATKTVACAMDGRKTYRFTLRWGEAREHRRRRGRRHRRPARRGPMPAAIAGRPAALRRARSCSGRRSFRRIKVERRARLRAGARGGPPSSWRRGRSRSRADACSTSPMRDHAEFEAEVGKGTYIRALGRDLGRGARHCRPCRRAAPPRGRAVHPGARRFPWINWRRWGIVPPLPGTCFRSRPRWTTSRHWP